MTPDPRFAAAEAEIRRIVQARLKAEGHSRYADCRQWLKGAALFGVMLGSYAGILHPQLPASVKLGLALILGTANLLLIFNLAHDAAHHALSRHKALNQLVLAGIFSLFGIHGRLWQRRHIYAHHPLTNVNGSDPDIDANTFLRLSPNHPYKPHFRWQHLYAPLVYMLAIPHSIFWQDFQHLRTHRYGKVTDLRLSRREQAGFWASKVFYLAYALLLPLLYSGLSPAQVLAGYALMQAWVSLVFVLVLAVNHFSHLAAFPQPEARLGFFQHQLAANVDWAPESRFWCAVFGGANAHLAHHLFPSLSSRHAAWIATVIADVTRRYGVPYRHVPIRGCVSSHFRFLKLLATRQDAVLAENLRAVVS